MCNIKSNYFETSVYLTIKYYYYSEMIICLELWQPVWSAKSVCGPVLEISSCPRRLKVRSGNQFLRKIKAWLKLKPLDNPRNFTTVTTQQNKLKK